MKTETMEESQKLKIFKGGDIYKQNRKIRLSPLEISQIYKRISHQGPKHGCEQDNYNRSEENRIYFMGS